MSFYCTREVKASRRQRRCDECCKPIAVGEPYRKWSAVQDGEFWAGAVHGDCQDWANAVLLNEPGEGRPFVCDADPEEWLDRWTEPSPSVLARLPMRWATLSGSCAEVVF